MFYIFKKLRFLGIIFKNNKKIDSNSTFSLFLTYVKLLMKLTAFKFLHVKYTEENIFKYKIFFFDYEVFVALFESIFIENEYYFPSKISSPFIIDVGSNIGLSILYFKYLFPDAKIIGFEPDPQTFALLKKTIQVNMFTNIKLYELAISSKKAKAYFYNDRLNPGSVLMSLKEERSPKNRISVETDTLPHYIGKGLDLLKMDVEGEEEKIIFNLFKNGSLKKIKYMIFEYHHHIVISDDSFSKVLEILEKERFGYQIVTKLRSPIERFLFQDILVYAKRK